jgi:hypothetical protein
VKVTTTTCGVDAAVMVEGLALNDELVEVMKKLRGNVVCGVTVIVSEPLLPATTDPKLSAPGETVKFEGGGGGV